MPIFASLLSDESQFQEFVNYLRDRVELVRLNPGDVIFRQGDPADDFYLVRIGFVKVSQKQAGRRARCSPTSGRAVTSARSA